MSSANKPNEIYITRLYDAPLKMVWDAWTDPKQAAKWWGPRGFTITTHSKDLRVGGNWHYTMHGPDGVDYPNNTKYLEVDPYARLVYDHGGYEDRPPMFRVTVLFSEANGKTKMEMTMALPTAEAATETKKFIKKAGGNSTWDRLAEFLDDKTTGKDTFVINRTFDAPIDVMFKFWTDPNHLAKWVPPTGMTMKYLRADIKAGGSTFARLDGANGLTMFSRASYLEITKPNRIVYTQVFCDEDENLSRHPLAPTWPETMLTTVTLHEEGKDKTRVTIHWEVVGEATAIERATFHDGKPGMTQGWTGSFDKLDAHLSNL